MALALPPVYREKGTGLGVHTVQAALLPTQPQALCDYIKISWDLGIRKQGTTLREHPTSHSIPHQACFRPRQARGEKPISGPFPASLSCVIRPLFSHPKMSLLPQTSLSHVRGDGNWGWGEPHLPLWAFGSL